MTLGADPEAQQRRAASGELPADTRDRRRRRRRRVSAQRSTRVLVERARAARRGRRCARGTTPRRASPASTTARIMPSASAASVPGIGRRCSSATRAVRLRKGSTTTSRAPLRARVEQLAPQVRRGRHRVPAPDEHVARVGPLLGVDLGRDAVGRRRARHSRRSRRSCAPARWRRARASPARSSRRPGSGPACPCSCRAGSPRRRAPRARVEPAADASSASSHEAAPERPGPSARRASAGAGAGPPA